MAPVLPSTSHVSEWRTIVLPNLISAVWVIATYTLFTYFFSVRTERIPIRKDLLQIWIPLWISALAAVMMVRPRFRGAFMINGPVKRQTIICHIIWAVSVAASMTILQLHLDQGQHEIVHIRRLDEIPDLHARFYTFDSFVIDKSQAGVQADVSPSPFGNGTSKARIFIATPIDDPTSERVNDRSMVWIGIEYATTLKYRSRGARKAAWRDFYEESLADFEKRDLSQITVLERLPHSIERKNFRAAAARTTRAADSRNLIVLVPKKKSNTHQGALLWGFIVFIGGFGALSIFVTIERRHFAQRSQTDKEGVGGGIMGIAHSLFLPVGPHAVTSLLIDINVLLFSAMALSGLGFAAFKSPDLIAWGANYRPLLVAGQWWRGVTALFLHGGIVHLAINCCGLFIIGRHLEPFLGRIRLLTIYLATGYAAGATSAWWHEASVSIGASGAIFGLLGVYLIRFAGSRPWRSPFLLMIHLLAIGAYSSISGLSGGIDHASHGGGLAAGLLAGAVLVATKRFRRSNTVGIGMRSSS